MQQKQEEDGLHPPGLAPLARLAPPQVREPEASSPPWARCPVSRPRASSSRRRVSGRRSPAARGLREPEALGQGTQPSLPRWAFRSWFGACRRREAARAQEEPPLQEPCSGERHRASEAHRQPPTIRAPVRAPRTPSSSPSGSEGARRRCLLQGRRQCPLQCPLQSSCAPPRAGRGSLAPAHSGRPAPAGRGGRRLARLRTRRKSARGPGAAGRT